MAAPENELQKTIGDLHNQSSGYREISEHELRFRKSVEKLHVPEWYREYGPTTTTTMTSGVFSGPSSSVPSYTMRQACTYVPPPVEPMSEIARYRTPSSPPVGGIAFPIGMFDKYKGLITIVYGIRGGTDSQIFRVKSRTRGSDTRYLDSQIPSRIPLGIKNVKSM